MSEGQIDKQKSMSEGQRPEVQFLCGSHSSLSTFFKLLGTLTQIELRLVASICRRVGVLASIKESWGLRKLF